MPGARLNVSPSDDLPVEVHAPRRVVSVIAPSVSMVLKARELRRLQLDAVVAEAGQRLDADQVDGGNVGRRRIDQGEAGALQRVDTGAAVVGLAGDHVGIHNDPQRVVAVAAAQNVLAGSAR